MTFYAWLAKQGKRDDPVGALARDVMRDANFPKRAPLRRQVRYLRSQLYFSEGKTALLQMVLEYREYCRAYHWVVRSSLRGPACI